jgi:hypothetical protein
MRSDQTIPKGAFALCSNLLEHVTDRGIVVRRFAAMTRDEAT